LKNYAVYIEAIAKGLPDNVVTNNDLKTKHHAWNMEQIAPKTGELSRHHVGENELASDLGFRAVQSLIQKAGISVSEIGGLIFCTQSPDYIMPPNATILHAKLGLPKSVLAFDFTLACSGYVYGLAMAQGLMVTLGINNIILVTADTYSKYIHSNDRSAGTLFGDGGTATLLKMQLKAPPSPTQAISRLVDFNLETDGHGGSCFMIKAGGLRQPKNSETAKLRRDVTGNEWTDEHIKMDGKAVLDFAKREIPGAVARILEKNQLTMNELDLILFHQASQFALNTLALEMKIPAEKTFSNISTLGNTVSASLPLLLHDAVEQGKAKRRDKILLVGFGVGFSWGCCLLQW
jgi:3-oxoacyl-[acyl-carrier-protein] synthase III